MGVDKFARAGYAAKGFLYGIIGILAIKAAFSIGGKTTDSKGALYIIAVQPFGRILLILVAVGLFSYALWRLIQVIFASKQKKTDAKQIMKRIGYLVSGVIYGGLGFEAISILLNTTSSSGNYGNVKSTWTAKVLAQPFGQSLVVTGGTIIIGVGLYRLYQSHKATFIQMLDLSTMTEQQKTWTVQISRLGIAAKGIVFLIIGFFLIQAGRQYDPSKAIGLEGVLQAVVQLPFGQFLLALVGLGLLAYAIYLGIQARYRQILESLDS